jgi:hypothetical protein
MMELTQEEKDGIIDIIDGTIDSMLQLEGWSCTDFPFWINILNKLGEKGQQAAKEWLELGMEEAAAEADSAALLDLMSKLG